MRWLMWHSLHLGSRPAGCRGIAAQGRERARQAASTRAGPARWPRRRGEAKDADNAQEAREHHPQGLLGDAPGQETRYLAAHQDGGHGGRQDVPGPRSLLRRRPAGVNAAERDAPAMMRWALPAAMRTGIPRNTCSTVLISPQRRSPTRPWKRPPTVAAAARVPGRCGGRICRASRAVAVLPHCRPAALDTIAINWGIQDERTPQSPEQQEGEHHERQPHRYEQPATWDAVGQVASEDSGGHREDQRKARHSEVD